jgi:dimeric dUTPase (all-alpha-NTP-PPase superfamily)
MATPDQLHDLFRMQKALNERIGVTTDAMSETEKTKWVLNYCRAMTQEIAELTDSVPWKWWAKYQKFDEQNARVEVVDLFHFLISLAQVLGMSADDASMPTSKRTKLILSGRKRVMRSRMNTTRSTSECQRRPAKSLPAPTTGLRRARLRLQADNERAGAF